MNYKGLVGIEFKSDTRDGKYKLIEINPRSVSGEQLIVDSGIDIPYINYLDCVGESVEPVRTFREGVKWISIEGDLQSFLIYRLQGKITVWQWFRSLKGVKSFAVFDLHDPVPFLYLIWKSALVIIQKLLGVNKT